MALPLMPKATAVWLVENTTLTFEQIADFCGMHLLEIQAIANGEVASGIIGLDPTANGQLTREEISRCEANEAARLKLSQSEIQETRSKGARYTPVSKRQDRPDAISWLIKHHPYLSDVQICNLIGTTKPTILAVRERTHWNTVNIKPRNPVTLGLCTEADLEKQVILSHARAPKEALAPAPSADDSAAPSSLSEDE